MKHPVYTLAEADPLRSFFSDYAKESKWGEAGKMWVNEILHDERKNVPGSEIWDEFAGYIPHLVERRNPFDYIQQNMYVFDNMPTSVQWVADLIVKNANNRGHKIEQIQVGKHGVESDPSRYKRYMQMPAGAPPSFLNVPSGEFVFGVGRFIAALLRNDKYMYVVPVAYSEKERAKALRWLQDQSEESNGHLPSKNSHARSKAMTMRRSRKRNRNYAIATRVPPRERSAKAGEMGEEELLGGVLDHLQIVNAQINAIESFRNDIAAIRMDKELPLHPLTEDILAVYKDMNARYKEMRDYILGTLGMFSGGGSPEPELDLED